MEKTQEQLIDDNQSQTTTSTTAQPENEILSETSEDFSLPEELIPTMPDIPTAEDPDANLTEIEKLIRRRTGHWQVKLQPADVRWVKNACNGKFEFIGPNEAFMLMNCFVGFSGAIARLDQDKKIDAPVILQASAIEACAIFLNKLTGNGLETAQRVFRIAMGLNDVIMQMKDLDNVIAQLREEEKKAAELAKTLVDLKSPQETPQDSQALEQKGIINFTLKN